jgi:hypothetical protein
MVKFEQVMPDMMVDLMELSLHTPNFSDSTLDRKPGISTNI